MRRNFNDLVSKPHFLMAGRKIHPREQLLGLLSGITKRAGHTGKFWITWVDEAVQILIGTFVYKLVGHSLVRNSVIWLVVLPRAELLSAFHC
jgi:hypothetical protein